MRLRCGAGEATRAVAAEEIQVAVAGVAGEHVVVQVRVTVRGLAGLADPAIV